MGKVTNDALFRRCLAKVIRLNERKFPAWKPVFLEASPEPSVPRPLRDKYGRARRVDLSRELCIEAGDLVQVLHGPDEGKRGVVLRILPRSNKLIVENCNMTQAIPNPFVEAPYDMRVGRSAFLVESPIHITNVMGVDPVVKMPTRVKRRMMLDGNHVRISQISGCAIPEAIPAERLQTVTERSMLKAKAERRRDIPPNKVEYVQGAADTVAMETLRGILQLPEKLGAR